MWSFKNSFSKDRGFPDSLVGKESTYNSEDSSWISGREDSLEKGKAEHSSILA